MKDLQERFQKLHTLPREERIELTRELHRLKPEFMKDYLPKWWWWRKCKIKVLIVTDGNLHFGTLAFGLSEFLTAFNELDAQSFADYELTLAHRGTPLANSTNSLVVSQLPQFQFDSGVVNLQDFDQVWLFGINSSAGISPSEVASIETYMNSGGGVFATGDHGSLGSALCGDIPRVKDMRYWDDFPDPNNPNSSEVGMIGVRRNDTNQPEPGEALSSYFDNQSDDIPQTIAVRTFGGGLPHPLLSINPALRPGGIIDVMPDHPHEGECSPETEFTVSGITIPTQVISTSFVRGGSTTVFRSKPETEPHCFPSIAVWDGHQANVGRIVVNSTWHHFVNINLTGIGSSLDRPGIQGGLNSSDWTAVRQYYMNIARWMSRRRYFPCIRRWALMDLLFNSQVIEASLNDPGQKRNQISPADLNSIGGLAEEVLSARLNPSLARLFFIDFIAEIHPEFAKVLDRWSPAEEKKENSYYKSWIDHDLLFHTAIGAGFIALRDEKSLADINSVSEKDIGELDKTFIEGMEFGFKVAFNDLQENIEGFMSKMGKQR